MRSGEPRVHDPLVQVVQLKPNIIFFLEVVLVHLDGRPPLRPVRFPSATVSLLEGSTSML